MATELTIFKVPKHIRLVTLPFGLGGDYSILINIRHPMSNIRELYYRAIKAHPEQVDVEGVILTKEELTTEEWLSAFKEEVKDISALLNINNAEYYLWCELDG